MFPHDGPVSLLRDELSTATNNEICIWYYRASTQHIMHTSILAFCFLLPLEELGVMGRNWDAFRFSCRPKRHKSIHQNLFHINKTCIMLLWYLFMIKCHSITACVLTCWTVSWQTKNFQPLGKFRSAQRLGLELQPPTRKSIQIISHINKLFNFLVLIHIHMGILFNDSIALDFYYCWRNREVFWD